MRGLDACECCVDVEMKAKHIDQCCVTCVDAENNKYVGCIDLLLLSDWH